MGWNQLASLHVRSSPRHMGYRGPRFWRRGPARQQNHSGPSHRGHRQKTINYILDFGDNWEHRIKIGRITDPVPGELYPRLIEVTGKCPPEDVGGFPGYYGFLDAMADPKHPEHDHLKTGMAAPSIPISPNRQTQTRSPQSRKTLEARKTKKIGQSDRTLTQGAAWQTLNPLVGWVCADLWKSCSYWAGLLRDRQDNSGKTSHMRPVPF